MVKDGDSSHKIGGFVDLFFGIIATGSHTATGSHGVQGISNVGNFCLFSHGAMEL